MKKATIKSIQKFSKTLKLSNPLETILGAVILIIAIYFGTMLLVTKNPKISQGYSIYAEFDSASGVTKGTDVKISGMSIGEVSKVKLDKKTYRVKLEIHIKDNIKFSSDSSIKIRNAGLLGDKYLEIVPGFEDEMIEDNGDLYFTQEAIDIEDIIGKFLIKN